MLPLTEKRSLSLSLKKKVKADASGRVYSSTDPWGFPFCQISWGNEGTWRLSVVCRRQLGLLMLPRQWDCLVPEPSYPKSVRCPWCRKPREKNHTVCRKVERQNENYQIDLLGYWSFLLREKDLSVKFFFQSFPVIFLLMVWMMGQGVPSASLITENRVEQLRHQRAMLPSSGRSTTWRQGLMGTSTSTRERAQSCTCGRIKKILHTAGHAGGQLARKQLSRKGFGHEATLSLLSRKAERAGRV